MNTHMVYKWTRDNGQYYIGIHTNTDGKDPTTDGYIGSGVRFRRIFDNTPIDQWTRETTVLETRDHAESLEARLVTLETLADPLCLNLMTGGGSCGLGMVLTDETKAKMSAAGKGRTMSAEAKAKMSAAKKNPSAETRAKMSAASKGRTMSAEAKAKISAALKGKPFSAETKAKISAAKKGKTLSPETRAKISAANKGVPRPKFKCAHCDIMMDTGNLTKHHNDNCKHKPSPYKLLLVSVSPQATRTPIFNAMRLAA